jgi:hypothetical protein
MKIVFLWLLRKEIYEGPLQLTKKYISDVCKMIILGEFCENCLYYIINNVTSKYN